MSCVFEMSLCCAIWLLLMLACVHCIERPECRSSANCQFANTSDYKLYYFVTGSRGHKDQQVTVMFKEMDYLFLSCNEHAKQTYYELAADDLALPAMPRQVTVKKIEIKGCLVPNGTYYEALAALNFTFSSRVSDNSLKLTELPAKPRLEGYHLHGMPIKELLITGNSSKHPRPKFDFLDKIPYLQILKLTNGVVLEPEALEHLPEALEMLTLVNTELPAAESKFGNGSFWLKRLRSLNYLKLVEMKKDPAGLTLLSPPLAFLPNLKIANLNHLPLEPLSDNWLNGSNIQKLIITYCGLVKLPNNMFDGSNVTQLILTNNQLASLPKGVFSPLQWLTDLDLSNNNLNGEDLVDALVSLEKLKSLKVNNNPRLGSLCGHSTVIQGKVKSRLPKMLRHLELNKTNATRICDDWIEDTHFLMHLSLKNNIISDLMYSDLKMMRNDSEQEPVSLILFNNRLKMIEVTQQDLSDCTSTKNWGIIRPAMVQLSLDSGLPCDCRTFWLREVLRSCSSRLTLRYDVKCSPIPPEPAPRMLFAHKPKDFTCSYGGPCPPGCECRRRELDNATVVRCNGTLMSETRWPPSEQRWPLALHVSPGTLTAVPRVALVELHAPGNNITSLDDKDIPDTLRVLDVRNNSIAHITKAAALKLLSLRSAYRSQVSLAGNPLACACEDVPAIDKLKYAEIMDWNKTQCADGNYIIGKTTVEMCDANQVMLLLLSLMGTVLMMIIVILVIRHLMPHIRQFLFDHNMCLKWVLSVKDDPDDPMKTHDVFISYSFIDYEYAKKLIDKLEEHGHSTIEHCRDWLPGKPVSQQIAHSVISSRRTLLLVSDNYANSKWGLEEFHAAHAHAMEHGSARVIVVRCKLLAPHELPPELQLYLYNNTYLDWSDRYFWDKLWRVMPTPRPVPVPAIALLDNEKTPTSVRVQLSPQTTTASTESLSPLSVNKALPLSGLILVPPVSTASRSCGPLDPPAPASCGTPVVHRPPRSHRERGGKKLPVSRFQQERPLAATVVPAVSPCAC